MSEAPGPLRRWVLAARPRTLPAAMVPVIVGVALIRPRTINWGNSVLCLLVALALQVGTNYANDYSDGIRGTDEVRVGPFRLTASKLVAAKNVRNAAFTAFFLAGMAGLLLASRTSWWLVAIGATAIAAGWFYTGGPRPYGYYGFGELFVFIYFGIVATVGTAYVQHLTIPSRSWWLGVATGFMACALLEANNLRDVEGDRSSGKRTLAARLSRTRAPWLFAVCVAGVLIGISGSGHVVIGIVAILLYVPAIRLAFSTKNGRELLPMLQYSARSQLQLGALLALVLILRIGI
jgi:1,4-dihydroxy-2-naphthoate octaprenyltransferase